MPGNRPGLSGFRRSDDVPAVPVERQPAENRFLAARDGSNARLIDPIKRQLVPVRELTEATLAACRPHAGALGCAAELNQIHSLATANGADRQRARANEAGLVELASTLVEQFAAPIGE